MGNRVRVREVCGSWAVGIGDTFGVLRSGIIGIGDRSGNSRVEGGVVASSVGGVRARGVSGYAGGDGLGGDGGGGGLYVVVGAGVAHCDSFCM